MNNIRIKYFTALLGIIFFIGCKNPETRTESNPIFQEEPALREITGRIEKSPDNAALYYERGVKLHKMRIDSLAIEDFKTAARLDSTKAQYFSAVGDLLFENKDINGSIEWLQKAIAKNPTDRRAHLKIAKLFLYLRDYGKAFAEINIVLRENVHDPEAYFLKGMVYKDMKDTARAISTLLTAVQVSPDYREAVIQLGLMYSAKKDPIAIKYFQNAYQMDTTDVFPIYALGMYYQDNKDYEQAKQEYKKCIIRDRNFADAYFNMGYVLLQQDSLPKAYRQYDLVLKIDPANPTAYYNRGLCSELMDSTDKAIADYKQALRLDTSYNKPKEGLRRLLRPGKKQA
jgi:tetratricopeptide (TPR) repeat protein